MRPSRPPDPALDRDALGQPTPHQAQSFWRRRAAEFSSANYHFKTDLADGQARGFARQFDLLHEEFTRRFPDLPVRSPLRLRVFIFSRRADYLQELRTRWAVEAEDTGGLFFVADSSAIVAFWTEDLPPRRVHHVMQHEAFQQFAFTRFGDDLPVWLSEGLAEYYGYAVMAHDQLVAGQAGPRVIDSVKQAIELKTHVPLPRLMAITPDEWRRQVGARRARLLYDQVWSLAHFLLHADGGQYRAPLMRYLRLLNNGTRSKDAFSRAFGDDLDALEARWRDHAAALQPGAFVTAIERIEFLAEGALALSREGVVPESLEEMKTHLRRIDFTHEVGFQALATEVRADDEESFEIPSPRDDEDYRKPVFIVETLSLWDLSPRQRRLEQIQPTPAVIRTDHLRPYDLLVEWERDDETGVLRYRLLAR